ncbi:hypothetical protein G6F56_001737 [Rhizopus delemar]|nr:hypothetical protein G6F56_001737 [Rhizopus delemar]
MQDSTSPAAFLQALSEQFPNAIGVVSVNQGTHHGAECKLTTFIYQQFSVCISLKRLPILRPEELTSLLRKTLKVLHVGLNFDSATKLFFSKDYAIIDTTQTGGPNFCELIHEMHLDSHCIIMASWRGMEKHCIYCHKPEHIRHPDHLFRNCPKRATESVGDKRPRTDHIEPKVREVHQERSVRTIRKNRIEPITVGDVVNE